MTELCVGCFLSAQIFLPLDVVFHLIKWNSVRAAASGIWASQKITSYYRRLCAVVKIRGALGCFIGVVWCKGSCFMEEQNISLAANLCQVQDLAAVLFWVGIKGKLVISLCFRCRNPSITPLNPGMHTERHVLQEINTFLRAQCSSVGWMKLIIAWPLCRFAGPMERLQAEAELINRVNSTYLVRHRSREYTEYAISIK